LMAGQVIGPHNVFPPTDATQWRPYLETRGCDVIASLPNTSPYLHPNLKT